MTYFHKQDTKVLPCSVCGTKVLCHVSAGKVKCLDCIVEDVKK